jgi:hypothetical protein
MLLFEEKVVELVFAGWTEEFEPQPPVLEVFRKVTGFLFRHFNIIFNPTPTKQAKNALFP